MDIISNYMKINYLNCMLKAAISLRISSSWQRQAAANFDVSPNKCNKLVMIYSRKANVDDHSKA